jgi:hypothetical protein
MGNIFTEEYYSAVKKKEMMLFARKWIELFKVE